MGELLQANIVLVIIAVLIGVLVAWWIFAANRKTRVEIEQSDEEASKVAKRNQALIDSPPAAGALSSVANTQDVAAAPIGTDAEAGPAVAPDDAPHTSATEIPADPQPGTAIAPDPAPATMQSQSQSSAPAGEGDDLTQIKGLGPKLAAALAGLGITRYDQIAGWDEGDIDRIDARLGRFQGRIRRDNWVEQAKFLASGDRAGFENRFGRT